MLEVCSQSPPVNNLIATVLVALTCSLQPHGVHGESVYKLRQVKEPPCDAVRVYLSPRVRIGAEDGQLEVKKTLVWLGSCLAISIMR